MIKCNEQAVIFFTFWKNWNCVVIHYLSWYWQKVVYTEIHIDIWKGYLMEIFLTHKINLLLYILRNIVYKQNS